MDVLDSISRRRKALKNQNAAPTIERFVDIRGHTAEERIEITIRQRNRQTLALTLWSDRWVSVRASEAIAKDGWKYRYERSGRFVGTSGGRDLVQAVEASISEMFGMTKNDVDRLDAIWAPKLAGGPQAV
ncbi:hypothetical protein [Sphingopyxis sp. Root154]|uniref:hypothetical protein n=1 Tax=Sphingopyxis sp. Root154 TaxID=1736476 RepID=UPI0012E39760|nr:hypothetical protein [Sphingopyxis sp. Root154]